MVQIRSVHLLVLDGEEVDADDGTKGAAQDLADLVDGIWNGDPGQRRVHRTPDMGIASQTPLGRFGEE
jgi:hypothetical protein